MQPTGRCPRCGYVMTYDGYRYYCRFCGYPHAHRTFAFAIQSLERNLRASIHRVLEELKPKTQRQITYYPVNVVMHRPCANCGVSFSIRSQICPTCGTPRSTIPQSTPIPVTSTQPPDLDARVLDYVVAHGGTISISQAAQDLTISQTVLLSAIERLKAGGFLNQS